MVGLGVLEGEGNEAKASVMERGVRGPMAGENGAIVGSLAHRLLFLFMV